MSIVGISQVLQPVLNPTCWVCMIWQAMFGKDVLIGMVNIITIKVLKIILRVLRQDYSVCFGVDPGIMHP